MSLRFSKEVMVIFNITHLTVAFMTTGHANFGLATSVVAIQEAGWTKQLAL